MDGCFPGTGRGLAGASIILTLALLMSSFPLSSRSSLSVDLKCSLTAIITCATVAASP